jgi:hypothetical protein
MSIANFGIGRYCVVRTVSSGVHVGTVFEREGTEIVLHNTRRIHYWEGAFTLTAIALDGAGEGSRLSKAAPEILLTGMIEIVPCSDIAREWLNSKVPHDVK